MQIFYITTSAFLNSIKNTLNAANKQDIQVNF